MSQRHVYYLKELPHLTERSSGSSPERENERAACPLAQDPNLSPSPPPSWGILHEEKATRLALLLSPPLPWTIEGKVPRVRSGRLGAGYIRVRDRSTVVYSLQACSAQFSQEQVAPRKMSTEAAMKRPIELKVYMLQLPRRSQLAGELLEARWKHACSRSWGVW